ncbi:hypothetical protein OKW21_006677 [Catalinimonas alkaloidigena]|uniref:hypothetical protein n=1 Tax=Catalinimonas alkaloidigena TaxID=1075417 RepID=UPI002404F1EF|nr:hypothetical protein [Catalinimonas alkaloidigena]MDF9801368.1 hypothetical protein [Catalinimonas alkaloidigena]
MNTAIKYPLAIASVFLWIGFVCAISFMEAWLKFKAPGVSLHIGLGIGRLVFNVLNKVEWVLAFAVITSLLSSGGTLQASFMFLFIPLILLVIQTFWLLPALDVRAEMYIQGLAVPPSDLHIYYIVAEVCKVISLFIFGIKIIR